MVLVRFDFLGFVFRKCLIGLYSTNRHLYTVHVNISQTVSGTLNYGVLSGFARYPHSKLHTQTYGFELY